MEKNIVTTRRFDCICMILSVNKTKLPLNGLIFRLIQEIFLIQGSLALSETVFNKSLPLITTCIIKLLRKENNIEFPNYRIISIKNLLHNVFFVVLIRKSEENSLVTWSYCILSS